ncbi:MAG TPA: hypothetical protein VIZ28_11010 [Chitinophagaceae bacterium]
MKLSLTLILFILLLAACTKKDGIAFTSYLTSTKFKITSYPRVFTQSGEITDKTIIDNYVNNWSGNIFFLTGDTTLTGPGDTILFTAKDTILIPSLGDLWGKRVIKQNGNYLFLYMTDTLSIATRFPNVLNNIADNIGIAKPYYGNCNPPFGGPCSFVMLYDAFVARGNRKSLEFPLLTYKITRRTGSLNAGIAVQISKNVFDPSVLNLLEAGDTLAIQTGTQTYSNNKIR